MPQKLYGIAEFHPPTLVGYALNKLEKGVRKEIEHMASSLPDNGFYKSYYDLVLGAANESYQSQNKGFKRLFSYFQDKSDDIQDAIRAVERAKRIIFDEEQIIRRLRPDSVYFETAYDLKHPEEQIVYHHLFPALSELEGKIAVGLGTPIGHGKKVEEFRKRVRESPTPTDERLKEEKEEWRRIIEEKDHFWAPVIAEIAKSYNGIGLIVAGRQHLVSSKDYNGLTTRLLKEAGFDLEILLDIDPIEVAKEVGMPYK